jgi:hypothetical protein
MDRCSFPARLQISLQGLTLGFVVAFKDPGTRPEPAFPKPACAHSQPFHLQRRRHKRKREKLRQERPPFNRQPAKARSVQARVPRHPQPVLSFARLYRDPALQTGGPCCGRNPYTGLLRSFGGPLAPLLSFTLTVPSRFGRPCRPPAAFSLPPAAGFPERTTRDHLNITGKLSSKVAG